VSDHRSIHSSRSHEVANRDRLCAAQSRLEAPRTCCSLCGRSKRLFAFDGLSDSHRAVACDREHQPHHGVTVRPIMPAAIKAGHEQERMTKAS
jgi:hypothetical protein